ncbi:MAG: efflux RND transporter periplasmic adaptor subunit [Bacteroidales bacterium]|nr:efflux RND transporter periplasmic adaptor subunit [Bacteroidales bacterium]MCF8456838.1 efflux RND transporter periplasmic adaptor subunit [Bacteroidales bacterium]
MKTKILIIAGLFLMACGSGDKQSKLEQLKKQKEELTAQIEQLEKEVAGENGVAVANAPKKEKFVNVQEVQPQSFNHYIEIQGSVESDNDILVPAQSSGVVKTILVEIGDVVQKGQVLARLDAAVFELSIEELKNGLELATTVFERQERLWNQKIGSEIQYLQAKNQKESLEKKLATTMEQYEMTKIKAPISGQVDDVMIKEGQMAAAGFGTFKVVNASDLKIKATLSEKYITNIKKGDLVKVYIPVLNKHYEQKVLASSNVINPDNRTFSIEVSIPQNDKDIMPNMMAVLEINDYSNESSLVVPLKVVQYTGKEEFLFVATNKDGKDVAEKRLVKTGYYSNDKTEIVSGLLPGEQVVVFGYQNLGDGEAISIQ